MRGKHILLIFAYTGILACPHLPRLRRKAEMERAATGLAQRFFDREIEADGRWARIAAADLGQLHDKPR